MSGGDWVIDKVYPIPADVSVSVTVDAGDVGGGESQTVDVYCLLQVGRPGSGVVRVVPGVVDAVTGEVVPMMWDE